MKIGIYPGQVNIYNYIQELLNQVDILQKKHEVTVFLHPENEPCKHIPNVNYVKLPRYSRKYFLLNTFLAKRNKKTFRRKIFESKVELLWVMTEYLFHEIPIPYIFTLWDLAFREQPYFPELNVGKKGSQWEFRDKNAHRNCGRASYVVTGTERGKEELNFYYRIKEERIRKIPFPAPPKIKNETPFSQITQQNFILVPSRFHPHKNHITILLALAHLKNSRNRIVNAVCTGEGSTMDYIKSMAKQLGVFEQLTFLSFIDRNHLNSLYQNALALVFPTFVGPDNLPPLEAFALGCPVIASKIPGSEEQLGDAALLFDPKNEIELAQHIDQISTDETLRQNFIQLGYSRASRWTYDDYLRSIEQIVEDFKPYRRTWNHINSY